MEVPLQLASSQAYYFGEAGRDWVAALPSLAATFLDRWALHADGRPGCGAVALVLPVRRTDGTVAVLKLQPVDDETVAEPEALRLWAGAGAVRLLEHDPLSGSMLLERLDADRTLAGLPDDLTAVGIIAGLLGRLTDVAAPPSVRRLDRIAQQMLGDLPRVLPALPEGPERTLLDTCGGVLVELLGSPVDTRLLHWDLHYDNVLGSLRDEASQPWLAIDPKPLAGDVGFELLPALWNRWADVTAATDPSAHLLRRFDLMTEVLDLDRRSAAGWTLARVLQNAIWDIGSFNRRAPEPRHVMVAQALLASRIG